MKTLVLGASPNISRYSNMAVKKLRAYGHDVVAVGNKEGIINDIKIINGQPDLKNIDTITLYLGKANQEGYYNYILNLRPRRIIFNPGAENPELKKMAEEKNIEAIEACTLVMLSTAMY